MNKIKTTKPTIKYFNRELSWLAFNNRVLDQALSERYPLLERIRFLSFVCSNLDQFYEIRVAGLMQKVDGGSTKCGMDGMSPAKLLTEIKREAGQMATDKQDCWNNVLKPALKEQKVLFKKVEELSKEEFTWLRNYFKKEIFPILTPLAVDPTHPFPLILNKSLNIIVALKNQRKKKAKTLTAIVPVPRILPRLVKLHSKTGSDTFLFLSDVVRHFVDDLFPGHIATGAWAFRITRNSHLYVDEEEVENLLQSIEEELHNLRKGAAVRLEIDKSINSEVLQYLLNAINLSEDDVILVDGPINLYRLMSLPNEVDRPDLKFPAFDAYTRPEFKEEDKIFDILKKKDILLHHPYDSFTPVVDFLREAASDPDVFAIKLTIYRTNGNSPIVRALMDAARDGKQVTALVELKARFDEEANVQWAHKMEEVGVHVVYGLPGLKTHSKCCLVVRRENSKLKSYAHLGTGNYNPSTAKTYTDYSLFTSNQSYTSDLSNLFNTLTGYSRTPRFKKLLVAPFTLHDRTIKFIHEESEAAKKGKAARIIIKVNSLIDQPTIDALYDASQNGVKIDLIVRGICGLIPGVRGLSENIKVRSILGRFLEHSRVFYFQNAMTGKNLFVGSADWMPRNFLRRVEAVFPIEDPEQIKSVLKDLEYFLLDNEGASTLKKDGSYVKVKPQLKAKKTFSVQQALIKESENKTVNLMNKNSTTTSRETKN
ncbi:MAG: polyphosphate kinase 1 [Opitutae bacterium]|jgi:polyphosphate kinase|nr:polyphosphate kinase 1 [Opitutae bacterium]